MFGNILYSKKSFLDNKNINFGKMKNSIFPNELGHGFGRKFTNYLSFFFRENREGKSVWQYSLQVKTKDCDRPTRTPLVSCDSDAFKP